MSGHAVRSIVWLLLLALMTGWAGITAWSEPVPTMLGNEESTEGFELKFPSEPDFRYTIEYRNGLGSETPWQEMADFREVAGTGEMLTYVDTDVGGTGVMRRFYRLRIDPESLPPGGESVLLALYEFTETNAVPQVVHETVSATDFGISSGMVSYGSFNAETWTDSGIPYAQGNQGWDATNAVEARHFLFTVTAQEDVVFSVTNIRFLARSTGAGPSAIGIIINNELVHEQDIAADNTIVVTVPVQVINDTTQTVVRIPGWDNGSRGTTGGGHFRIDDVRLEGHIGVPPDPDPPTLATPVYTNVSDKTATLGGTITDDGNAMVTERGVYWSTTQGFTPPGEGTKVSETGDFGSGAFTVAVSDLPPETPIYFRAFATNAVGMGITSEATFTTERLPVLSPPAVTNPSAMNITETTALLGGSITNDGGGIIIERGVYWSLSPEFDAPDEGNKVYESGEFDLGAFSVQAQNLPGNTEIFLRAFASNAEQTGFSELYAFTTLADDDLAFYSFTGNTVEPESHRESIDAATLTISAGSIGFQYPAGGQASEWEALGGANPQVVGSSGWAVTNRTDAKHFLVALSAESGSLMTITNISYLARSTAQGPSAVGIALNGTLLHEVDSPANTVILVQSPVTGYADITGAVIRVQGWDNGSRGTTGGGELQVDNILVQGFMSMNINVEEPVVTSPSVSNIGANSATLGGTISDTGGSTITERGIYWSTVANFPLGGGTKVSQTGSFGAGAFTVGASQLPAETVIYFRAFARSAGGTAYSDQLSFTTAELEAALLSLYEFTEGEVTPHARHPNVTSSHLVHNTGRPGIGSNNEWAWTGSGVPYAQVGGGLAETDVNSARHFIYAIEARTGTTFDITNITFLARATAQGPSAISVSIDGNVIHTQNMPDGNTISVSVPVSGFAGRSLSRIRILGWDNGSRDTAGTGLLQIDDVRTEGAVAGSITQPVTEGRLVRVASYNTENGIGEVDGNKYNAMKATLQRVDADIVAFQELYASQSNEWVALATELGYGHTALAPEGGQRTGYFSRFPIQSTQTVGSPAPANEMARPVWRAVIDVPGADLPLVIWNAHNKAIGDEVSQFRRAVETIRVIQDIDAYSAANTAHVEYIVLGDMNADLFTQPQSISFSEAWYNANAFEFPASYELGEDITFPVLYARFPEDRYTEADHGFYRSIVSQADGNGIYSFLDNNFISRLDYLYVSEALAAKVPAGEIYHSKHDGAFPGLPKAGDPLPPETSWTSSDHLPVFIDVYMSDTLTASGFAETSTRFSDETQTQDDDGATTATMTIITDDDEPQIESEFVPRRTAKTLMAVAEVTRLEIIPLPDGRVELRFPSETDFLYTIESVSGIGNGATWVVVGEHEYIPGTGEPVSRVDDRPVSDGVVRFYRLRVEMR